MLLLLYLDCSYSIVLKQQTSSQIQEGYVHVHFSGFETTCSTYSFIVFHLIYKCFLKQSRIGGAPAYVFISHSNICYYFNIYFHIQNHLYMFHRVMKIHEGGLLQIWKKKWWPKANFCTAKSFASKAISLVDVQSAFYVCVVGIFFGSMAFLIEILFHKYRMYRQKRKKTFESNGAGMTGTGVANNSSFVSRQRGSMFTWRRKQSTCQ